LGRLPEGEHIFLLCAHLPLAFSVLYFENQTFTLKANNRYYEYLMKIVSCFSQPLTYTFPYRQSRASRGLPSHLTPFHISTFPTRFIMKTTKILLAALLTMGLSSAAFAQTTAGTTTGTTSGTMGTTSGTTSGTMGTTSGTTSGTMGTTSGSMGTTTGTMGTTSGSMGTTSGTMSSTSGSMGTTSGTTSGRMRNKGSMNGGSGKGKMKSKSM
jgi:hypothetical protein